MAPKIKVNYRFPVHPSDMFARSPATLSNDDRVLRVKMIEMICNLSQTFDQGTLDDNVRVDVKDGCIVGLDMSKLWFGNVQATACEGTPVPLKRLSAENWITMTFA